MVMVHKLGANLEEFRTSATFSDRGRGSKQLPDDLSKDIILLSRRFYFDQSAVDADQLPEEIQATIKEVSMFAIAKNSEHVCTEMHYLS